MRWQLISETIRFPKTPRQPGWNAGDQVGSAGGDADFELCW